jgi:undecaprenol kinase
VDERPEIPEIKPVSESGVHSSRRKQTEGSAALKANLDVVAKKSLIPLRWQRKTAKAGSVVESFYHAFHGVRVALTEQRNLRIHVIAAVLVTIMGLTLGIDIISWIALTIIMSLVIACELINTSLEHLVDISADGKYRYAARCAKDTAAAAVLTVSIAAIIVGLLIFGPKLIALF